MGLISLYIAVIISTIVFTFVFEHIWKKKREELIHFKNWLSDISDEEYERLYLTINRIKNDI